MAPCTYNRIFSAGKCVSPCGCLLRTYSSIPGSPAGTVNSSITIVGSLATTAEVITTTKASAPARCRPRLRSLPVLLSMAPTCTRRVSTLYLTFGDGREWPSFDKLSGSLRSRCQLRTSGNRRGFQRPELLLLAGWSLWGLRDRRRTALDPLPTSTNDSLSSDPNCRPIAGGSKQ